MVKGDSVTWAVKGGGSGTIFDFSTESKVLIERAADAAVIRLPLSDLTAA